MPYFEVTCYETVRLTRTFEADTASEAKELAEADVEGQGWEDWDETSGGPKGMVKAVNLDTLEETKFEEKGQSE